jgi:hypothetical protein
MAHNWNRHSVPRRKRMKRQGRLSSVRATGWVQKYKGKNIIAGYSKWFAVDPLCALIELRLLGVKIDEGREEQIKASTNARAAQRARRKKMREQAQIGEVYAVPNDFLFIADCTEDYLPDWVFADELQEAPWCDEEDAWRVEEEEFIEPPVSPATAELVSSESAHPSSDRAIYPPEEMVRTSMSNQTVGLAERAPAALLPDHETGHGRKSVQQGPVNVAAVAYIADPGK